MKEPNVNFKSSKKTVFLLICWLLMVLYLVMVKGILPGTKEESSDFYNYYIAAKLWSKGEPIAQFYDNGWFAEQAVDMGLSDHTKFAPFPPATSFLYWPLTAFPPLQAKQIWLVINLLLLLLLLYQAKIITQLSFLEITFVFSLFATPIASNLRLGQSYFLFTACLFFFLKHLQRNTKSVLAGSVLGFAAALKYFPIIYGFPHLRKKQLFVGFLIGVFVVSIVPLLTDGIAPYSAFFKHFVNHTKGNLVGQGQFSYTFQSIDALLANLFIYDAQNNPNALMNVPVLKTAFKLFFTGIVLLFIARTYRKNPKPNAVSIGIYIVAAFLLLPATANYHLLLLIPIIVLITSEIKPLDNYLRYFFFFFVFACCNVLPHHIPIIENSYLLNTILHFPRLYTLMGTFVWLLYIQKYCLKADG